MFKILLFVIISSLTFSTSADVNQQIIANVAKLKGSEKAVTQLLCFFNKYKDLKFKNGVQINNHKFIAFQDFTLPSSQKRFFLIDLNTTEVRAYYSSHGMGTNKKRNQLLYPEFFSNELNSYLTPSGFHITSTRENSSKGWKWIMRLDGVQGGVNDNSRKRAIVYHAGVKSYDSNISTLKPGFASSKETTPLLFEKNYRGDDLIYDFQGLSNGCTTLAKENVEEVYDAIKDEGVIYNFTPREDSFESTYCGDNILFD